MRIPSGVTDQYIYFVAVDVTDLKTRETGLSGFTVYRSRNGGTSTAWTTPTVVELSSSNQPGEYALLVDEDTTLGAGSDSEEMIISISHASMARVTRVVEIYRREVTAGETLNVSSGALNAISDGLLTAAKFGADFLTAAKVAADVGTEIATAVWAAATRLLTGGDNIVLAKGVGVTGFNDLDAAGVRGAVGLATANLDTQLSTIDGNVDDILTDTAVIGTPAGVSIAADIAAIEAQTDDIGAAGAGLSAIPWNAAWDAEVQSEVADALAAYDPPTKAELDAAVAPLATAANLATVAGYIDTEVAAILEDTGTTLPAQIAALNNLSAAEVNAEVDAALADYDGPTKAELDAAVATLATPADVNAQVLDVLNVDTFAEPGQGAPPATATLQQKISYMYKAFRNKIEQTGSEFRVYDDAGTTVDQKATVSDDGSVFTRGEIVSGP